MMPDTEMTEADRLLKARLDKIVDATMAVAGGDRSEVLPLLIGALVEFTGCCRETALLLDVAIDALRRARADMRAQPQPRGLPS